jgi:hypothetical protein
LLFPQALERQPWIGRAASAPILVMLVAALASAAQAIPQTCAAYDLVWSALMPFGAALCLLEVDLTDLARCFESSFVQVWEQPAGWSRGLLARNLWMHAETRSCRCRTAGYGRMSGPRPLPL